LTNNGGCDEQATCKNIQGGFECVCKEGYEGNGLNCNSISTIPSDQNQSNQGIGIGIGVGVGVLAFCLLVLLILFFLRKNVIFFFFLSFFLLFLLFPISFQS